MSAPETPFGTQLPSEPPAKKKSSGALWVIGGLLVAAVLVGGALVATKFLGAGGPGDSAAATPPVPAPTASAIAEVPAPVGSGEKLDESGAIDLNQLAVEKGAAANPGVAPQGPAKPPEKDAKAPDPKEKDAKDPKEKDPKKPDPKKGTGFVPPPVTDPGF